MPTKSGQTDKSEIRKNELTFRASVSILKHVDKTRGACVQAERKLRTSTHIPDLDNANVGTLCKRVCNCEDTEKLRQI